MVVVHPFPGKLSPDQAEEVRRLRTRGAALAELAEKFGIAKSSVSAVVHYHSHARGTLRVALPEFEAALLAELAEDEEVPVERLAANLIAMAGIGVSAGLVFLVYRLQI